MRCEGDAANAGDAAAFTASTSKPDSAPVAKKDVWLTSVTEEMLITFTTCV
jgi:hypothetical protein